MTLTLYYIYNNRKKCSFNHYITFLQTEYEVLKFSKKKNIEEEIRVLKKPKLNNDYNEIDSLKWRLGDEGGKAMRDL